MFSWVCLCICRSTLCSKGWIMKSQEDTVGFISQSWKVTPSSPLSYRKFSMWNTCEIQWNCKPLVCNKLFTFKALFVTNTPLSCLDPFTVWQMISPSLMSQNAFNPINIYVLWKVLSAVRILQDSVRILSLSQYHVLGHSLGGGNRFITDFNSDLASHISSSWGSGQGVGEWRCTIEHFDWKGPKMIVLSSCLSNSGMSEC